MQNNQVELTVITDLDKIKNQTADAVTFEIVNGDVIMNFMQSFPSEDNAPYKRRAKISSRVKLSWGQFVRMIPQMIEVAQEAKPTTDRYMSDANEILKKYTDGGLNA